MWHEVEKQKFNWEFMEMDIHMAVNNRPRLSPTLFQQLKAFAEFKANFQNVCVRIGKDSQEVWYKMPNLVDDIDVQEVVDVWLVYWREPTQLDVRTRKLSEGSSTQTSIVKKKKE